MLSYSGYLVYPSIKKSEEMPDEDDVERTG